MVDRRGVGGARVRASMLARSLGSTTGRIGNHIARPKPMRSFFAFPFALVACAAGADSGASAADQAIGSGPSCDARDYGAKGDGVTKDTAAIQRAIDACAGKHGEVHLQNGTFLSGTITLKSSMIFHVHGGATLLGSQRDADYPDLNPPTTNSQTKKPSRHSSSAEPGGWYAGPCGWHPAATTSAARSLTLPLYVRGGVGVGAEPPEELRRRAEMRATLARGRAPLGQARPPLGQARPPLGHARGPLAHARAPLAHARAWLTHARAWLTHARARLTHARPPPTHARAWRIHARARCTDARSPLAHARSPLAHARSPLAQAGIRR
jgi:hypothetical protein